MDKKDAARAFKALAQPTRLAAFRRLVAAGRTGLAAGDLAARLEVPHNTLSAHLSVLEGAGLIAGRTEGRMRRYAVDAAGVSALTGFMLADCCGGRPELCLPAGCAEPPAHREETGA